MYAEMNASTRVAIGLAAYSRNAGKVNTEGPPWSTTVVTPERTPTMSASSPNRPLT